MNKINNNLVHSSVVEMGSCFNLIAPYHCLQVEERPAISRYTESSTLSDTAIHIPIPGDILLLLEQIILSPVDSHITDKDPVLSCIKTM